MTPTEDSKAKNNAQPTGCSFVLYRLASFSVENPKAVLFILGILIALSVFSSMGLRLKTSNLDLIDADLPEVKRFLEFSKTFGTPNALVIVLESRNSREMAEAVNSLGSKLRALKGVRKVFDKLPAKQYDASGKNSYLSSRDASSYYIFVQPKNIRTEVAAVLPLVADVRSILKKTLKNFPGIHYGLTGIPQYSLDDQEVIQSDISLLSWISLLMISLLFIFAFQTARRPLTAVFSLLVGALLSLGIVAIIPGHLTLLSAPFAMMIFGLGIDYGIHLISFHEEQVCRGEDEKSAIVISAASLARTLTTACATTVGVFLVLLFSGFLGFKELGIILSFSLPICLLMMFTLLPALLSLFGNSSPPAALNEPRLGKYVLALQSKWLPPAILLISVFLFSLGGPGFDSDYLNLQPSGSESVRLEREMVNNSDYSPYFAAFVVDDIQEAASLAALLRSYDEVGKVSSLSDFLPEITPEMREEAMRLKKAPKMEKFEIPQDLRGILDSGDGQFAVIAYPAGSIWDPAVEKQFLTTMREIDSEATGMPFIGNLMIARTKAALKRTGLLSLFVLLFVLAIDFRNPISALIAAGIPLLSVVWMQAAMRILGIPYNPLNIMALPIVIGIAVDDSVHIAHRFLNENGNLQAALSGSGRSVVLTTLTTLAAFACLALTSHRGLRSFSIILSLGVSFALLLSLTVLPWLLERFRTHLTA